jgi:ketosteroid isomerase-like protein
MGAKLLPGGKAKRWLLVSVVALAAGLGGLLAACGGEEPMSKAEIVRWKTDAIAFADRFHGAWPDVDASFAQFADDATFYDPTNGDFLIEGKQRIVALHRWMFSNFPGFRFRQKAVYLSGGGAAYKGVVENLWPPGVPEPADHPPVEGLDLFWFKDGLVVNWEIWAVPASLEMLSMACFAPGEGGSEQLRAIADRYLAAWSSGDKDRIAGLYRDDAAFSDSMRGIQAQGAAAIAEVGDTRFGSGGPLTLEVIDLYVQTNDGIDTSTEQPPEQGAIIAVGIHYRYTLVVKGESTTGESLTTFELGTRHEKSFAPDPSGLITREEVFHNPDSFLASGLVR